MSYQEEYRLGIFGAMGPIEHHILFGMVCSVGLLLAASSPVRAKALTIAGCGVGVLLSLSSAPIQSVVLGFGLITYDRIFARYRSRWSLLIGVAALGIGASYIFTSSPLAFIFGHLLLDPTSYSIRLYQWNAVGTVILDSPWVGIAFEWSKMVPGLPFFVQESVDSLWLYLALIYGIPGAVLAGLSMAGAACSSTGVNLTIAESKLATTL